MFRPASSKAATVTLAMLAFLVAHTGCSPSVTKPTSATSHDDHDHAESHSASHGEAKSQQEDHDHDHDEPTSFADGIAKLESLGGDLAKKLGEGASEAADDAVHDLGHLLEVVREFANKESFAGDAAAAVTAALDELEECFGKVDEAFHSGDEKADPAKVLDSVKERLTAAFKALKSPEAIKAPEALKEVK
jgi:ABC-type transporter Mla subunit MlaD